jgi:hypothetical protein
MRFGSQRIDLGNKPALRSCGATRHFVRSASKIVRQIERSCSRRRCVVVGVRRFVAAFRKRENPRVVECLSVVVALLFLQLIYV